jgi:hypothetical protein
VDDGKVFAMAQHSGTQRPKELTVVAKFEGKIFGIAETMKTLRRIDPEMAKEINAALKEPGKQIVKLARGHAKAYGLQGGLSGWGSWPRGQGPYDPSTVSRGIGVKLTTSKRKGQKGSLVRVTNKSAAGSIYEMAGRKNSGNGPSGVAFIQAIQRKSGSGANRLIYRAFDDYGGTPAAAKAIEDAVEKAEATVKAYLDKVQAQIAATAPKST